MRYLTNVDMIERDQDGGIRFHFLLAAVLCEYLSGMPVGQDDVSEAQWWKVDDVMRSTIQCSEHVDSVVKLASNF